VFLSLEDEVGIANVIVRPATYKATKAVIDTSAAVVVEGVLQNVDGVLSVLAARIEPVHLFVSLEAHEWQ
jgi:error-prone DNA polymerase